MLVATRFVYINIWKRSQNTFRSFKLHKKVSRAQMTPLYNIGSLNLTARGYVFKITLSTIHRQFKRRSFIFPSFSSRSKKELTVWITSRALQAIFIVLSFPFPSWQPMTYLCSIFLWLAMFAISVFEKLWNVRSGCLQHILFRKRQTKKKGGGWINFKALKL